MNCSWFITRKQIGILALRQSRNSCMVMGESWGGESWGSCNRTLCTNYQQTSLTSSHELPPFTLCESRTGLLGEKKTLRAQLLNLLQILSVSWCQNRKRAAKFPHNNFLTLVQVFRLHHCLTAANLLSSSQFLRLFPSTNAHIKQRWRHLHLCIFTELLVWYECPHPKYA